ncbi:retinoic acid-induced protein 1 [Pungitius pungitius]|uniref:retinoic acid-induced protein 1 n=1 Tax=Pungitius pungitius TaxID=134920 RepID=UPI002E0DBCA6
MEVSPQDPALMAMDLSKSFSLTRGHAEAMDLAKKPEWYHRRPPGCSTELGSPYRSRASSSYGAALHPEPGAPLHRRDVEPGPESLGGYVNSSLAPGLELYRDGGLWRPGFYGPDQTGGPVLESSGGEESDSGSGSDIIFLVSSAEEPLLCGSFLQDDVRRMAEPAPPAGSSLDGPRGRYRLPRTPSSPSPDSSYSEESSDSSADIPVHHARPVVLLSDLGGAYGKPAASPPDASSDDSDVVEVSVTDGKERTTGGKSRRREAPSHSEEDEKASLREVRRSPRTRKPASDSPPFTCGGSRHTLGRRAKSDAVGIYNESCGSDDAMDYAVRLFTSDAGSEEEEEEEEEEAAAASQTNLSLRASAGSEEAEPRTDMKSPPRETRARRPAGKVSEPAAAAGKSKRARTERKPTERKTKKKSAAQRRKRSRSQAGPAALFSPREPEIKLKYANVKKEKKSKRVGSFCPFVHVRKKLCAVVNYEEDEESVRGSGARRRKAPGSPSGFVPGTSCFQLGRSSLDGGPAPLCSLCGQTANAAGLGDLHGPYRRAWPGEGDRSPVSRRSVNSSEDGCRGYDRPTTKSSPRGRGRSPPRLDEAWIHEDCGVWSAGVFLVGGKLFGLEEAARLARETVCSACQQTGAVTGCFQKGCARSYHYRCALHSDCVLNEENFSLRCPQHKNKLLTVVTRQQKR